MAYRKHINNLAAMIDQNGQIPKTAKELCNEETNFFTTLYNTENQATDFPDIVCKEIITEAGKTCLNQDIECVEIKQVVFECNDCKAPGPDSFNSKFYKLH